MSTSCFVLMPFGSPFNDYYKGILCPAIRDAGLEPIRADEIYGPRPIIDDIMSGIRNSVVLVADVTGRNPNVNYELGLAHAFGRDVVIVSQSVDDIPFDYRHLRAVIYDTTKIDWALQLKVDITKSLESVKQRMEVAKGVLALGEWDFNPFWKRVVSSRELCQQAVSSYGLINESVKQLENLVLRGGLIRIVLVDPESQAVEMAAKRLAGAANDPRYIRDQIKLAIQKLSEIAHIAPDSSQVSLRVADIVPEPIVTFLDPNEDDGVLYATLNGFQAKIATRPSFIMERRSDSHWFHFFRQSFQDLWQDSREVRLL